MNAKSVLFYGNAIFLNSLEEVPSNLVNKQGVYKTWSIKDIVSHISSYERVLVEIFESVINKWDTMPKFTKFYGFENRFDEFEIEQRKDRSYQDILSEYKTMHELVMQRAEKISPALFRKTGTIPWYGKEFSLDDLIVHSYYGHKIEHSVQIDIFLKLNKKKDFF